MTSTPMNKTGTLQGDTLGLIYPLSIATPIIVLFISLILGYSYDMELMILVLKMRLDLC